MSAPIYRSLIDWCGTRLRQYRNSKLHARKRHQHKHFNSNDQRNRSSSNLRRRLLELSGNECNSQCRDKRVRSYLHREYVRCRLQSRARDERRRSRRADRHHSRDRNRPNHNLIVNLLAVMLFATAPAAAQEGDTTNNISNPIATSTGSVNNQAVQINQGGFSRQTFGGGVQCNGPTMVFSPFYLGNDTHGDRYVRSQNFGAQISFSVPLDGGMTETCKSIARKRLEKERLDYENKEFEMCELLQKGFTFRPESPFAVICNDIVPINCRASGRWRPGRQSLNTKASMRSATWVGCEIKKRIIKFISRGGEKKCEE